MSLLYRHGRLIMLAVIACAAGAWVIGAITPVQYASVVNLDVEAAVHPYTSSVPPNLPTEQQVATSGVVIAGVSKMFGLTPAELAKHLHVTNSAGTNILSVKCTMPTATEAMTCAREAAKAYRDFRNYASSLPNVQATDPLHVTILTPATMPSEPSGTPVWLLLCMGAILGLALGVGWAYLRDRTDDRIRDRADFEQCLDSAVLAEIPPAARSQRSESVFSRAPLSPAADAYRYLRLRLDPLISPAAGAGRVLLVASAQASESRTCVAANLAAALSQAAGATVLLVDADPRHPAMGGVYDVGEVAGLTDVLSGRVTLNDVIVPSDEPGLMVLTVGTRLDRPARIFDNAVLSAAFRDMRSLADIVVVDSPPVSAASDSIALSLMCDVVALVADVRHTRRAAVRAAVHELGVAGPRPTVGILCIGPRARRTAMPRPASRRQPGTHAIVTAAPSRNGQTSGDAPTRTEPQAHA